MQQHAEAADGAQSPRARLRQERRVERHIDDVVDDGVFGQQRQVEVGGDVQRA
mgnify:CR=1 FL=1